MPKKALYFLHRATDFFRSPQGLTNHVSLVTGVPQDEADVQIKEVLYPTVTDIAEILGGKAELWDNGLSLKVYDAEGKMVAHYFCTEMPGDDDDG